MESDYLAELIAACEAVAPLLRQIASAPADVVLLRNELSRLESQLSTLRNQLAKELAEFEVDRRAADKAMARAEVEWEERREVLEHEVASTKAELIAIQNSVPVAQKEFEAKAKLLGWPPND
jgi:chromosome segregation ATPase